MLALAFLLTALLWWLPNRPHHVRLPPGVLRSVSFAAYRDGQSPLLGRFPSAAQVDQDLALLAGRTHAIRTYAAIEGDYDTVALARAHGLKVWQGIWLGSDPTGNAREIAAGIALANRYPDTVERVVVGNEVLLRGDLPPEALIAALDQVRAVVRQPVTYADVWEFWLKFPQIAQHVDQITIHLLPYWENTPIGIDRAVAHVAATYDAIARRFPGRPIVIGETGWPTRGRWRADAAPGVVNQARFLQGFLALARERGFDYNLIEAFDQRWKYQDEGVVGANWGLFTADRREKFPSAGPVIEDAGWPAHAAFQVALALILLGFAHAWRPIRPGVIRSGRIGSGLTDPELTGSGLIRSELTERELTGSGRVVSGLAEPELTGSGRIRSGLTERELIGSGPIRSGLTGPGLTGSGLTGPNLTGPNLTGPNLTGPSLTGPSLTGPRLIAAAFILAGALALAQASIAPELYDVPRRLAAAVNLCGQTLLAGLVMHRLAAGRTGAVRTGAQARETVRGALLLRPPPLGVLLDDLSFLFVWTAAVLQALLVYDPRYRDFPLPAFAVPLAATLLRGLARDLPIGGGGPEEAWVGLALAGGAVASAVQEGFTNGYSLTWSTAALVLATPLLLRCVRHGRLGRRVPPRLAG
jgi:exo-beta-1,3-glucanase (GH17 family)